MRVYMHLARRANKDSVAWPSYQSIGDHCFSSVSDNAATRKSFARKALEDLIKAGLIVKTHRVNENGEYSSNAYQLVNPPVPIDTPMPIKHTPVPIDTPMLNRHERYSNEDSPVEDTTGNEERTAPPSPSQLGQRTYKPRIKADADNIATQRNKVGLTPAQLTDLTNAILDRNGKRAIADLETDMGERELVQARECALGLAAMGHKTTEAIDVLFSTWRTHDWRGEKGELPSYKGLVEHAAAMPTKSKAAAQPGISKEERERLAARVSAAQSRIRTDEKLGYKPSKIDLDIVANARAAAQ
jgi:hypothetical protein